MSANPLLVETNHIISFSELDSNSISEASQKTMDEVQKIRDEIVAIPKHEKTTENSLIRLDELSHKLSKVLYPIYLMSSVHPSEEIRKKSDKEIARLSQFSTELQLDEALYQAMKTFSESEAAASLTGVKKKFLDETIREYERNGFALPKEKRKELKDLLNKLSEISIQFHGNIAAAKGHIDLGSAELAGLPENYIQERKQEDGSVRITLDTPSYLPFMKYADSERRRKELYQLYLNRAADKNRSLLKDMLILRKKVAELLGYKSFAEYNIENRMAKSAKTVWDFEESLLKKVDEKASKDYAELMEIKRKHNGNSDKIEAWEKAYYTNKLLNESYQLDQEELRSYFELDTTISGMFSIFETLFEIEFREAKKVSKWHEDVRLFDVYDKGQKVGRFYMDLHPRDNKYSHAACFSLISGRQNKNEYEIPTAALVCNFAKASEKHASLLYHRDVETLFHEFGHVLHSVLTKSELHAYSGTSVSRDFVETPSQLLENWCWNYESLKQFAKHYKSKEVLPKSLFDKMISAKNVGSGIDTQQQLFYGILDMSLYDNFDAEKEEVSKRVESLQNKLTKFPYLKGTHFEASFGHLDGYAAGYYGYLWSKVYAQDIFSVFEEHGVSNPTIGRELKEKIYEKGGSEDEFLLLESFLKREADDSAFIKSLAV